MSKKYNKKQKKTFYEKHRVAIIASAAVALAIAIVFGILYAVNYNEYMEYLDKINNPVFIPPSFDENAEVGNPADIEAAMELGFSEIYDPQKMSYKAAICGVFSVDENLEADIYFANPKENSVWLKLRVCDGEDDSEIICETGLIRPGEFIKTVKFSRAVENQEKLSVRILSYTTDGEYMSMGTFKLVPYVIVEN